MEEKGEGNNDTEKYQVGDTIKYTIQARNTVRESVVENFVISDILPEGLTYVEGSLEVSHDGIGTMEDGTLTANFGNVTDVEWRIVTFLATIDAGQSGQTIQNTATVDGDNVEEPDEPSEEFQVDPREPRLESEKTYDIAEKFEGNTDAEHPEVGDILTYTIQTRNMVEDSLVKNLTIRDVLPEGLEYVAESLTVDGVAVTDEEDNDAGHSVNGEIFGSFGDITDTEWHKVTFQVVVGEGQAGQDIKNIATVDGDNIDEPDEPSEEVLVYPREPKVESEKMAENVEEGKEVYEVGDTIKYTIQARNTVKESVVENFVISDVLPEGLSYVEDSLELSHDGSGNFEDGTITAAFGDVTDIEWRIVTFLATIDSGQSGQTINNTATVDGDNFDEPDKPAKEITVDPKEPKLDSEKSASIAEKLEGNTDTEHAEVGDILTYTIQTRNTIEDSLVESLTIRDTIPEGLEYVVGSLTVDGVSVTDEADDDAGHSVDGEILGAFGDITDTEWHTLTFQVVVGAGQAGQDIINIALVDGENVDTPEEPKHELLVYPRIPVLESEKSSSIVEKGEGNSNNKAYQVGDTIEYTIQARNTVKESLVTNFEITDVLPEGLTFIEGSLEASHEGVADFRNGIITAKFGDVSDTEWRTVTFQATIDSGQVGKTLQNIATVDGGNIEVPDKPENEITVNPRDPELESEKTSAITEKAEGNSNKDYAEVGDILTYTIQTRNTVPDSLVSNLIIADTIPDGLEYLTGTLTVDGNSVTDAEDDDAGESINGEILAEFGDITDTEWHSIIFQVKVKEGQAGKDITNIAVVEGDNVTSSDKPENEVRIYPRNPEVESEKTAVNAKEGKNIYEVGDRVIYTIKARNTVQDSVIEDLVISDALPKGLSFVEGTIEVSHDGNGSYKDGTITASFGDVADTEWRTITFHALIDSKQTGDTIENIATVDGGNINNPETPIEAITIEKEVTNPPAKPSPEDEDQNGGPNPTNNKDGNREAPVSGKELPKTATNHYNFLLIGAALFLLGLVVWISRRKVARD
ncbi:isopeptide-forming domain-containing fimbrial protein [Ornithinibacillus hominis]